MKHQEPEFRCGTKKAIEELVAEYGYPYDEWMQDWPYEIADPKEIENYFRHYDEQSDEDKKFSLMEMLIQALDEVEHPSDFEKYWTALEQRIRQNFDLHEYTIFYWCCFEYDLVNCWHITPKMRVLWNDMKSES